ncbi:metalloregulator ArsR/SmtB family transcription factor [Marinobacter arenosus]|uniref:metalloregulator ArsR/SmtB family transcription factor n=1 Tax=Marinobacter arenosus TaxID=2856822 RepID=UPI0028ACB20D|nr:metalloregulator ArsR/SmtB family transcription factor [Marinobacter arenosus]
MANTLDYHPVPVFKALGDENRLTILLLIRQQTELCVCELTAALNLSQPRVSRHLAYLREHNLLQDERRGQWVYYRLHPELPEWVQSVLDRSSEACAGLLAPISERLDALPDRPVSVDCS